MKTRKATIIVGILGIGVTTISLFFIQSCDNRATNGPAPKTRRNQVSREPSLSRDSPETPGIPEMTDLLLLKDDLLSLKDGSEKRKKIRDLAIYLSYLPHEETLKFLRTLPDGKTREDLYTKCGHCCSLNALISIFNGILEPDERTLLETGASKKAMDGTGSEAIALATELSKVLSPAASKKAFYYAGMNADSVQEGSAAIGALQSSVQPSFLYGMAVGYSERNPALAAAALDANPKIAEQQAYTYLASVYARFDPLKALLWSSQVPSDVRHATLSCASMAWALNNTVEFENYTSNLPEGEMRDHGARALAMFFESTGKIAKARQWSGEIKDTNLKVTVP